MGSNYHAPIVDGVNTWQAASINPIFSSLDRAVTYLKNVVVLCDGDISWNGVSGELSWTDDLYIRFNRADGQATQNVVAAGSVVLEDDEFAYVDLSEVNGATVTVAAAAFTGGAASNFLAYSRLVLGHRAAASDEFFPVALKMQIGSGSINAYDIGCSYMGQPDAGATILRLPIVRLVNFPSGFSGSRAVCVVAPTAEAVFSIQANGVEIGTITFAIGETAGVFAGAAGNLDSSDILTIVAPNPQDASLSDIGITLAGVKGTAVSS